MPTLDNLHLIFVAYRKVSDSEAGERRALPLTRMLLDPLFRLRHMQRIVLSGFLDITLTDTDLVATAAAWPKLQEISFYSGEEFPLVQTTLFGIQALYNGCPHLQRVEYIVNDRIKTHYGTLDIPAAEPHDAVEELVLHFRAVGGLHEHEREGSSEYIPMLVRLMFPQLKRFTPYEMYGMCPWEKIVKMNWGVYRQLGAAEVRAMLEAKLQLLGMGGEGHDGAGANDNAVG